MLGKRRSLVPAGRAGEDAVVTSVRSLYEPIAEDLELVEDALQLVTRSDFAPLQSMLEQVLQRAGKRLRPAIALLAGGFGEYETDNQVALAASIELLHTATLVHDDVIDASDTRRGQPTANSRYKNAAAVMLAASYTTTMGFPSNSSLITRLRASVVNGYSLTFFPCPTESP